MSEDQGMQGDLERIDEDELYIRDYIHTFGSRYAKNFWAIKFAAPIDLSNGETAAGIGFHGKGRVLGLGGYYEGGGMREFDFWMLNDEDKQALADQLPFGNCGLFAFERHEPSDIEEESMFHKSPETIRKYIRDNGHVPKDQLCPACKFKKPVKIHLRYKEPATAIGMCCPEKNNGGPWVLLDCGSNKCGAPEVDLSQLVDSDKFKCCDQLTQGDAGEFDWETIGPQEEVAFSGETKALNAAAMNGIKDAVLSMPWSFSCPQGTFNATIDHNTDKVTVTPETDTEVNNLFATKLQTLIEGYLKELPKESWIEVNFEVKKEEK